MAYVQGLDPKASFAPEALPVSYFIDSGDASGKLVWSFNRAHNPYLHLTVQSSNDLQSWQTFQPNITVDALSDQIDQITIVDSQEIGADQRRFLRFNFRDFSGELPE